MQPPPLTREALFSLVWSEPVSQTAARYGISDRGLGKLCVRHSIPVPPRGWWARKRAGQAVHQTPLPPLKRAEDKARIVLSPHVDSEKALEPPETVPPEVAFELLPENRVIVPARLNRPHPLVEKTRAGIEKCRPDVRGWSLLTPREGLAVSVSPSAVPRALRLWQTLVVALESRGHSVAAEQEGGRTVIHLLGEKVLIRLREFLRQSSTRRAQRPSDYLPSGELCFETGAFSHPGVRDLKETALEDRLNAVIVKLVQAALDMRESRARQARQEAATRERERRAAAAEAERRAEKERVAEWNRQMRRWRKAREVRAFIEELRRVRGPFEEGSDLAAWVRWAEAYATRIDPFGSPAGESAEQVWPAHGPGEVAGRSRSRAWRPELSAYGWDSGRPAWYRGVP